jgi:hypothetical protein
MLMSEILLKDKQMKSLCAFGFMTKSNRDFIPCLAQIHPSSLRQCIMDRTVTRSAWLWVSAAIAIKLVLHFESDYRKSMGYPMQHSVSENLQDFPYFNRADGMKQRWELFRQGQFTYHQPAENNARRPY